MSAHYAGSLLLKAAVGATAAGRMRLVSRTAPAPLRFLQRRRCWEAYIGVRCCCHNPRRAVTSAAATPFSINAAAAVERGGAATSTSPPPVAATDEVSVVSRLSISRNATVASSWETVPNWCELCVEPINNWDNHVGKRDHICMEMTLNAMVSHPRSWAAADVWWMTEVFREHYAKRPRNRPRTPSANVRRMLRAGVSVPAVDSPMNIFYEAFDKGEPADRREEILLLLMHLKEKGFLTLSPENFSHAVAHGQLVLFKELMPLMARVFPDSAVRGCSAMTSMTSSSFNAETTYLLCGMEALIPPELLRAFLNRKSAPPKSNGNGEGASSKAREMRRDGSGDEVQSGDDAGDTEASTDEEGVPQDLRANMPRAVLGSLRWSLEPDTAPPPPALYQQEMRYGYYSTLAARASRLLLSELLYARVSESVYRVEEVMRSELGQEMMRRHNLAHSFFPPSSTANTSGESSFGRDTQTRALYAHRLVPHLSNHGIVEFTGGVGLCATKVLGTVNSNYAIHQQEAKRATRMKTRKPTKQQSGTPLTYARTVRAG
ncbi:putative mitochondrial KREPB6 (KREPB6) [Leptomonas pyrrhocoris]|uniref:Putative mitochondrial KREPB6 (KREPB6) n=1 Tax=Leptomonas pyrrhocoris TaxID=157538 RepID=A0A0M9G1W3_LEPPY|nr:putative mitochondrial KREPB6 (KREPB6) [Leptomonas pyrrhocoris]XP_015658947.1 putative mitochondrial KREPB6 (KREPB6) [Leptomonas pyrrhocoris]KPA80507.1 putative mitochondrial KREPB6 (KREPB6) [Leptomonas pyrrhocoris]KPA80508.1 putative mitochondrial KREPB6 (KREPB6) [Leptomonas pyrrhocoris]|eukprot:XP_015658946.1 putative mitochondrial KREPB6 (KREPB6) [Leptomonas pyrrhocoris]